MAEGPRRVPVDSQPNQPATRVYLQGIGHVKVNQHRPVGVVKTISVKREGRRWFVVLSCNVPAVPLPGTGVSLGIDMGVITSPGPMTRTWSWVTGPVLIETRRSGHGVRQRRR
jgi:hypothetical protein